MKNNQKITVSELADLLCEKTVAGKQQAEDFFKSLFSIIEEKLLAGEQVKINNFGVFKLQWNEPRKSVNINTGEEFVIDGFYKLAFAPEQKLKDAVNEPFAHLEPIALDEEKPENTKNDPLRNLHEQAAEIKNILSEISGINFDNDNKDNKITEDENIDTEEDEAGIEDFFEENEENGLKIIKNETIENNIPEEIITQETETEEIAESNETETENILTENKNDELKNIDNEIVEINIPEESIKQEKEEIVENHSFKYNFTDKSETEYTSSRRKTHFWLWILIAAVLAGGIITWIVCADNCCKNSETVKYRIYSTPKTETAKTQESLNATDEPDSVLTDSILAEHADTAIIDSLQTDKIQNIDTLKPAKPVENYNQDTAISAKKPVTAEMPLIEKTPTDILDSLFNQPRVYTEFIAVDTIRRNVFLTTLALKYYGSKDFWVYIYEANSEKYTNPNTIPLRSEIKIPVIDKRLIDNTNPRCKEKAISLQNKYLKR